MQETDNAGTIQATYTYGKGLISMNKAGVNSYYHYDGLGSTRQLTDSAGVLAAFYTYDSFGNLIASSGTSANTYGFTGQQQFTEADNLVFLRARYYDPRIGRFISRDPILSLGYYANKGLDLEKSRGWHTRINPRGLNAYIYCLNNPVNLIDPTGGCSEAGGHLKDIKDIIDSSEDLVDCFAKCTEKFSGETFDPFGCKDGLGNMQAYNSCRAACLAAASKKGWPLL